MPQSGHFGRIWALTGKEPEGHPETDVRNVADDLAKRARDMMTDDSEFIYSISGSTGDIRNVRTRFGKVREVVEEVLR